MFRTLILTIVAACLLGMAPAASAKTAKPHMALHRQKMADKMVAYDAKDKRFYSVAWAKAHGMHDKGGDLLTVVPFVSLPKDAQESKAMKGAKI